MGSLGNLGTARPPVDLDFGWFGATIRVNPRASDLSLTEFMSVAEGITMPDLDDFDEDNPTQAQLQQMASAMNAMASVTKALQKFMREQIHPQDWDEFWRLARENGQQNSDLLAVSKALSAKVAEHATGFPTGPSSDSAPTRSSTSKKSTGGSSSVGTSASRARRALAASPAVSAATQRRHQVQDAAAELLAKRPDLRLALWHQRQEQDAAEGLTA
jgi:hypothetical protein